MRCRSSAINWRSQLVGGGGFKGLPANREIEIGYETRLPYRRTGIASEAVSAQVLWALNHPSVTRVTAEVHVDNVASIGVLMKLAFDHVGEVVALFHPVRHPIGSHSIHPQVSARFAARQFPCARVSCINRSSIWLLC